MINTKAVLLVHGGAGTIPQETMTPEREAGYREGLEDALRAGFAALQRPGGTSLDAVEAAIRVLEDSPLFNAGKGSVFNRDGCHELDASVMEGRDRRAGAVAAVTRVKNPVAAARRVLEASGHVLMAGPGADRFAEAEGLETVPPAYFRTERRWEAYQDALRKEARPDGDEHRFGTVGAVARDRAGDLAAGASTGGLTFKRPGRVGDSPIIGSGVYAENGVAAVSCTGDGEAFIRLVAAHEVIALMKYAGLSVVDAANRVVQEELARLGAEGGLIALGADGSFALPFNSQGMYRGLITAEGIARVAIYSDGAVDARR
jgi:beta-aspartyl-peptidase (threonine type)